MSAGATIEGEVVSRTVTVKLAEFEFPEESVAVHMTVVVPRGNVEPDAGPHAGVRVAATASVAVGGEVTTAPLGPVASTTMGCGIAIVGGVVSKMRTLIFTTTPGDVKVPKYAKPPAESITADVR